MGCVHSSNDAVRETTFDGVSGNKDKGQGQFQRPKWKSQEPVTLEQIQKMRAEFWDTQPHYGGDRVIWDALKAACEAEDLATARLIVDSAGIIVASADLTVCYDERGAKYELPNFVLSNPVNLMPSN